jgi:2-iminobutanoate/2-iminopropanoate deaminase
VGIDREKGEVPSDIKGQTRQCFKNLEEVLDAAGLGFDDVAKVNVYLTDMSEFSDMNEAYKEVFPETPPARTTVGVDALASDDFRIEIELVALN